MSQLLDNYEALSAQIKQVKTSQMPTLVAVSKTKPTELIRQLAQAGHSDFGENYLQEAVDKIKALSELDLNWHFIGGIQRNKTRDIAAHFDWVHTVDRAIVAKRLSDQRRPDQPALNICVQLNIDQQDSKNGVTTDELSNLLDEVQALPNLRLRGLMCISDPDRSDSFARMQAVFRQQQDRLKLSDFDTLSMGMSQDWQEALKHGSTMIRVGSALFGARE